MADDDKKLDETEAEPTEAQAEVEAPAAEEAAAPEAAAEAPVAEAEQADEPVADAAEPEAAATEADASEAEAAAPEAAPEPVAEEPAADEPAKAPAPKPAAKAAATDGKPPVVRAQAKYVRTSARKARLVCDHIRGKSVEEARAILAFTPRAVAKDWAKLLNSAVANAEHNHELLGEDLKVEAAYADEGPTLKRFQPRAMGRATRIRKRTSHLTITLTPKG